jgi:hypothetical protein
MGEVDPEVLAETLTDATLGNARRRQATVRNKVFISDSSFL